MSDTKSGTNSTSTYEKVKRQFGKTAQNYVTSAIHAKSDDLKVMLELFLSVISCFLLQTIFVRI